MLKISPYLFIEESENTQEKAERSYGSVMMERLTGSADGRVDHVLQVCTFTILPLYSRATIFSTLQFGALDHLNPFLLFKF